jgi:hypothetical protein
MLKSIWVRPAVSNIMMSAPARLAAFKALWAISRGAWSLIIGSTFKLFFSQRTFNCSCAAGL